MNTYPSSARTWIPHRARCRHCCGYYRIQWWGRYCHNPCAPSQGGGGGAPLPDHPLPLLQGLHPLAAAGGGRGRYAGGAADVVVVVDGGCYYYCYDGGVAVDDVDDVVVADDVDDVGGGVGGGGGH